MVRQPNQAGIVAVVKLPSMATAHTMRCTNHAPDAAGKHGAGAQQRHEYRKAKKAQGMSS
jgi:hypothetical protein